MPDMPADDLPIIDELGEALYRAAQAADRLAAAHAARPAAARRRPRLRVPLLVPATLLALTFGLVVLTAGGLIADGGNRSVAQPAPHTLGRAAGLASVPMPLHSLLTFEHGSSAPQDREVASLPPTTEPPGEAPGAPSGIGLPTTLSLDSITNLRGSLQ